MITKNSLIKIIEYENYHGTKNDNFNARNERKEQFDHH